jgi:exonuclease VII large subunit
LLNYQIEPMNPVESKGDQSPVLLPQLLPAEPDLATQKVKEIERGLTESLSTFQALHDRLVAHTDLELKLTSLQELTEFQQQQIHSLEARLAAKEQEMHDRSERYADRSHQFQTMFENFEAVIKSLKAEIGRLKSQRYDTPNIDSQIDTIAQRETAIVTREYYETDREVPKLALYRHRAAAEIEHLNRDLSALKTEMETAYAHTYAPMPQYWRKAKFRHNPTANLEITPHTPVQQAEELHLPDLTKSEVRSQK